jgi:hypothetical protein
MPDPLEGLLVVAAGTGRVTDDPGIQTAATSERLTEGRVLRSAVIGVAAQSGRSDAEPAVPLDRAAESARRGLDRYTPSRAMRSRTGTSPVSRSG